MAFKLLVNTRKASTYKPKITGGDLALKVSKEFLLKNQVKNFEYATMFIDDNDNKIAVYFHSDDKAEQSYKVDFSEGDNAKIRLIKYMRHFNVPFFKGSITLNIPIEDVEIDQALLIDLGLLQKREKYINLRMFVIDIATLEEKIVMDGCVLVDREKKDDKQKKKRKWDTA